MNPLLMSLFVRVPVTSRAGSASAVIRPGAIRCAGGSEQLPWSSPPALSQQVKSGVADQPARRCLEWA